MAAQVHELPVVAHGLRPAETYAQLCHALQALQDSATAIFDSVESRVDSERGRLRAISSRIRSAEAQIASLAGSTKAITIYSSAKYPQQCNLDYEPVFGLRTPQKVGPRQSTLGSIPFQGDWRDQPQGTEEALELFRFFSAAANQTTTSAKAGRPQAPLDLRSTANLLLFDSTESVLDRPTATNGGRSQQAPSTRGARKAEPKPRPSPPRSILRGDVLAIDDSEQFGFRPTIEAVPALDLPAVLPDLPMIADVSWSGGIEGNEGDPRRRTGRTLDAPDIVRPSPAPLKQSSASTSPPLPSADVRTPPSDVRPPPSDVRTPPSDLRSPSADFSTPPPSVGLPSADVSRVPASPPGTDSCRAPLTQAAPSPGPSFPISAPVASRPEESTEGKPQPRGVDTESRTHAERARSLSPAPPPPPPPPKGDPSPPLSAAGAGDTARQALLASIRSPGVQLRKVSDERSRTPSPSKETMAAVKDAGASASGGRGRSASSPPPQGDMFAEMASQLMSRRLSMKGGLQNAPRDEAAEGTAEAAARSASPPTAPDRPEPRILVKTPNLAALVAQRTMKKAVESDDDDDDWDD